MHVYYYDDGLRWLINDVDDYIMMMYFLYSIDCYLEYSSFGMYLYSCIIYMAKMFRVKY
jgi:hypothetical protein